MNPRIFQKPQTPADYFSLAVDAITEKKYKDALIHLHLANELNNRNHDPKFDKERCMQLRRLAIHEYYRDAVLNLHPGDLAFAEHALNYLLKEKYINDFVKAEMEEKQKQYAEIKLIEDALIEDNIELAELKLNELRGDLSQVTSEFTKRLEFAKEFLQAQMNLYANNFAAARTGYEKIIAHYRANLPVDQKQRMFFMTACENLSVVNTLEEALFHNKKVEPVVRSAQPKSYQPDEKHLGALTHRHYYFITLVLRLHNKTKRENQLPDKKIYNHCRLFLKADDALLNNKRDEALALCEKAELELKENNQVMLLKYIAKLTLHADKCVDLAAKNPEGKANAIKLKLEFSAAELKELTGYKEDGAVLLLSAVTQSFDVMFQHFFIGMWNDFQVDNIVKFASYYDFFLNAVVRLQQMFACEKIKDASRDEVLSLIPQKNKMYSSLDYFKLAEAWRKKNEDDFAAMDYLVAIWLQENRVDCSERRHQFAFIPQAACIFFKKAMKSLRENQEFESRNYWLIFKFILKRQIHKVVHVEKPFPFKKKFTDLINLDNFIECKQEQIEKAILAISEKSHYEVSDYEMLQKFEHGCESFYQNILTQKDSGKIIWCAIPEEKITPINVETCVNIANEMMSANQFNDIERIRTLVFALNIQAVARPSIDPVRQNFYKALFKEHDKAKSNAMYVTGDDETFVELNAEMKLARARHDEIAKILKESARDISVGIIQDILVEIEQHITRCIQLFMDQDLEEGDRIRVIMMFKIASLSDHALKKIPTQTHILIKQINFYICAFTNENGLEAQLDFQKIISSLQNIYSDEAQNLLVLCYAGFVRAEKRLNANEFKINKLSSVYQNALKVDRTLKVPFFDVLVGQYIWKVEYITELSKNFPAAFLQLAQHVDLLYRAAKTLRMPHEKKNQRDAFAASIKIFEKARELYARNPDLYLWEAVVVLCLNELDGKKYDPVIVSNLVKYENLKNNNVGYLLNYMLSMNDRSSKSKRNMFLTALFRVLLQSESPVSRFISIYQVFTHKIFAVLKKCRAECEDEDERNSYPVMPADLDEFRLLANDEDVRLATYFFEQSNLSASKNNEKGAVISSLLGLWICENSPLANKIKPNLVLLHKARVTIYFFDQLISSLSAADESRFLCALNCQITAVLKFCGAQQSKKKFNQQMKPLDLKGMRELILSLDGREAFLCDANLLISVNGLRYNFIFYLAKEFVFLGDKINEAGSLEQKKSYYERALKLCTSIGNNELKLIVDDRLANLNKVRVAPQKFESKTTPLPDLFAECLEHFKKLEIKASVQKFQALCKKIEAVTSIFKTLDRKGTELDLEELEKHRDKREFEILESKLLAKFASEFSFAEFALLDLNKFLLFFVSYFDKKLYARAGKLSAENPAHPAIKECYENISDVLPELKEKAENKLKNKQEVSPPELKDKVEPQKQSAAVTNVLNVSSASNKARRNKKNKNKDKNKPKIITTKVKETPTPKPKEPPTPLPPTEIKKNHPDKLPLGEKNPIAKRLLEQLSKHSLKKRAYAVGGLVCEIAKPLKKSTDIDLVFGAIPKTPDEQKNPEIFIMDLLQDAFPNAVIEQKDKRLFKVTLYEKEKISVDIWWSAALSCDGLTNEEALAADTFGGEWGVKTFSEKIKNTEEFKQHTPGRDFTMNAMYLDADENLYDPTNAGYTHLTRVSQTGEGSTELKLPNPHLKCIINADMSFGKDPIRALRAIYFASKRNLKLNDYMKDALRKISFDKVEPAYRVTILLKKLFTRGDARRNFELLRETNILSKLFPSLSQQIEQHPAFLKFILENLSQIDDLQKNKKFISLGRIFHTWIYATIMRRAKNALTPKALESEILEEKQQTYFKDFFNDTVHMESKLLEQSLKDELNLLEKEKNIKGLRSLIKIQMMKEHDKRLTQVDEKSHEQLNKEFDVELREIQLETNFEKLVEKRKVQNDFSVVQARGHEKAKTRNKHHPMEQAKKDWASYQWDEPDAAPPQPSQSRFVLMPAVNGLQTVQQEVTQMHTVNLGNA